MKGFLQHRSHRFRYDGWALFMPGAEVPLYWTVSTTRKEVRELRKDRADLFERGAKILKVKITVEVI